MHIPTPCCLDAGGGYGNSPRSCIDPEGRTFRGVSLAYLVNHPELYWNREKCRDNYPTPVARDYKGTDGSWTLARNEGKFESSILLLPNFVDFVLEGNEPTDTGDFDREMERIEKERRKHGRVQLADTDIE